MLPGAIEKLTTNYHSHSFVIDEDGAKELFKRTRRVNNAELDLIGKLGSLSRWQNPESESHLECLSAPSGMKPMTGYDISEEFDNAILDEGRPIELPRARKPDTAPRGRLVRARPAPEQTPAAVLRLEPPAERPQRTSRRHMRRALQRKPTRPKRK